jgi:hypothetical protein
MSADYEKIVGKGTDGDFVKEQQGVATDKGFGHISKLWYPQTHDYDYGFEQLEKDIQSREDILCKPDEMEPIVTQDGKFRFAYHDGREFKLDDWSVTQYSQKMGVPVGVFNWLDGEKSDDKDARILCACVRNGFRKMKNDKKLRFRTYNDDTIRAVLSQNYATVDNRWYLQVIKECIPGGRLSHWRGDADTMYGNVLIPDSIREEKDSEYGGMISIGNCEIGKRRLSQYPSVFRAICMNGCIWSQTKGKNLNKVHRGKDVVNPVVLRRMIAENIQEQIPLTSAGILKLLATQTYEIVGVKKFIAEIGSSWAMKPEEVQEIATQYVKHESAFRNLFGIVNAITRAGQQFEPKRWVDFDNYAGELVGVTADSFNRMKNRADNLSDEFVNEVFGA